MDPSGDLPSNGERDRRQLLEADPLPQDVLFFDNIRGILGKFTSHNF